MKAVKQITLPEQVTVCKKLPQKEFKLPVEDSMKIVEEVRKIQKHSKTIRPDQNRKQYQQLLQWVGTRLEATKELVNSQFSCQRKFSEQNHQPQSVEQQIQFQQRIIIQNLMQHMTQMFKRQCKQKSQLMQVCLSYFNQLIHSYTKYYEKEYNETLNAYNITLTQMQDEYAEKIAQFNKKITTLEGQKQTKWKNIYMLAKDNRILRRQKGKLMRNIQEQEEKMKILEEELCSVTKQNQMNKLIIRFQNDSENLKVFMKNRLALMKFQKIIERYPKKAMKVLHSDLLKLQIQELNSLDSKIDYIRRVITESGDIFDQYEDLNQLMSKPNKMVFNMYSQTNSEDIEPPKEFKEAATNTELQVTTARFQLWEQLYDVKIVGFPELREKYVCFRNPNKKATINKTIKKKVDNQKKDFFVMQICSRQTFEVVNIRNKSKGQQLRTLPTVGVIYNPKLKNRSKLNFISAFETKFGAIIEDSEVQPNDLIFRQTMPANIKKQSVSKARNLNRKSQSQGFQGKYAYNRLSTQNLQGQKRYSELSSFQKTVQESRDEQNQTIDEKSQFDSENRSDTYTETQQNKKTDNQESEQYAIKKFKKTTKRSTRKTTNELSAFGLERKSSALRNISNQAIESGSAQKFSANVQKMQKGGKSSTKTQRISTESGTKRKKPKNSMNLGKLNRIKTTQNERDSKSSSFRKGMDFIEEEQQENEDHQTLSWDKIKQNNRLSYKQPLNSIKSSRFYDTINNLGSIKENYMNQIEGILAERNKKYHMTMMPGQFSANKSIPRSNMRNSSFNLMKFKPRQSVANVDTCSMNSHISSQNESTFNYKNFMTQLKPKQQATQTIESDHLGSLSLKPFEVKKISQKLVKSIYTRRKQLLSSPSPMNLKNFIQNFLKQIYGNNWKGQKNLLRYAFTIDDRETSSTIKVFTLMMNVNVHVEYLEDLFRLYVTMLERNQYAGDNPLITNKAKGAAIIKYMLSIYFDENTAIDIQQNLPFLNQYEIDLNEIFVVLQGQLRKNTIQTEIYQFMLKLLPENQSNIEFNQLKEILYLFKNEQKYHTHIARLKYFFKTHGKIVAQQQQAIVSKLQSKGRASNSQKPSTQQKNPTLKEQKSPQIQILPIHRVCLYLKRYQWTDLMDINSFVQEKYHKIIGVFIQQEIIKFITKYCVILTERSTGNKKNANISSMMMSISVPVQQTPTKQAQTTHPLAWMLERAKQLIRNFYQYKGPLDRYFLMFVHLSILTYELQIGVNDVLCDSLGLMSIQYKKLKTKEEVDLFMKE